MERAVVSAGFHRIASAPRRVERWQHGDDGSGPRLINRRRPDSIEVERLYAPAASPGRRERLAARILACAVARQAPRRT